AEQTVLLSLFFSAFTRWRLWALSNSVGVEDFLPAKPFPFVMYLCSFVISTNSASPIKCSDIVIDSSCTTIIIESSKTYQYRDRAWIVSLSSFSAASPAANNGGGIYFLNALVDGKAKKPKMVT
ncbi:hypothetical protein MAR_003785, partial [Mya arenaria]